MWRLCGTKLINKKGFHLWQSNDDWRFVPEGTMFYIQNIANNEVLSVAAENDWENEVKEMPKDDRLYHKQLWKFELPNEEGFFNVVEPLSNKVLSANTKSLELDGKTDQIQEM